MSKRTTRTRLATLLSVVALALGWQSVNAVPVAIDQCMTSGSCIYGGVAFANQIQGNDYFVHSYFDVSSTLPEQRVLVEYHLGSASREEQVTVDPVTQEVSSSNTGISGVLWLDAAYRYDTTQAMHAFTLHFDQVLPPGAPQGVWYDSSALNPDTQTLHLTTEGLLRGYGESFISCCDPFNTAPFSPFSMEAEINPSLFGGDQNPSVTCLAEGCYSGGLLGLLGIEYLLQGSEAVISYKAVEDNSLLYFAAAGYEGYTHTRYAMNAIPLPASLLLMLSGMISLGLSARKGRRVAA